MKNILTLSLLLLVFSVSAQCNEMTVFNDDLSGTTKIKSNDIEIADLTIRIQAGPRKGSYPKVYFTLRKGCVESYGSIIARFTDGSKLDMKNLLYNFNCEGKSGMLINMPEYKNNLSNKMINLIRIYKSGENKSGDANYYEVELTEQQGKEIQNAVQCALSRNWEGEIKYKNTDW